MDNKKKVIVIQDWYEDENSKTGWESNGWCHEDISDIPDGVDIIYDDPNDDDCQFDKYGHPIKGYYLI